MEATMATTTRSCPACGITNNVPMRHLTDVGRCGKCAASLPAQRTPIDVDSAALDDIVRASKRPVLIDFWAPWCGPCRLAAPEVGKAAQALQGEAVVVKVNTEAHPQLAARFGVRGIPMFAVVDGGQIVAQRTGLIDAQELVAMVHAGGR
jgi:thioredoxin 2